nr:hypothetical protein [Tanacetum cinerariifolium]
MPLEVYAGRDPKGLYKLARVGKIREEDAEEEEEDPEEDPKEDPEEEPEDDDDDMEMDDEAEVMTTDRTVRNVMSDSSGVKKLVKGLSDRFDEYERSKVFDAKRVLEEELNAKEFYREFSEYMCRMLQNRQKSEGSFPLHFDSQVQEPPAEPSARPVPAPYPDDPYVVTRYAAIADAAIATSGIDDDDDDTAPTDS